MNEPSFTFGACRIDPAANAVLRDGQRYPVEPRAMDVLVALCGRPQMVMSIGQLLTECWPGADVGDNPVHKAIAQLRRALGDSAATPCYIETIRKRGYRTLAAVGLEQPSRSAAILAERHCLAVAPDGSEHLLRMGVSPPQRDPDGAWCCVASAGLGEHGIGCYGMDAWAAFARAMDHCAKLGRMREQDGWRFFSLGAREPVHFAEPGP